MFGALLMNQFDGNENFIVFDTNIGLEIIDLGI